MNMGARNRADHCVKEVSDSQDHQHKQQPQVDAVLEHPRSFTKLPNQQIGYV